MFALVGELLCPPSWLHYLLMFWVILQWFSQFRGGFLNLHFEVNVPFLQNYPASIWRPLSCLPNLISFRFKPSNCLPWESGQTLEAGKYSLRMRKGILTSCVKRWVEQTWQSVKGTSLLTAARMSRLSLATFAVWMTLHRASLQGACCWTDGK